VSPAKDCFFPSDTASNRRSSRQIATRDFTRLTKVRDSQLYLTEVYINLRRKDSRKGERGELQFAPGIKAIRDRYGGTYIEGMALPIRFIGGLVLADGFVREESVHWDSRPTWCHNDVRELVFQHGSLTEDHDRSQQIAEVRAKMKEQSLEPDWERNRIASELTGLIFSRKYCE
jgi:hypothetical protein